MELTALDIAVLTALLRLARRHAVADEEALYDRVRSTHVEIRLSMRKLDRLGLIRRGAWAASLTMPGFALAVSFAGTRQTLAPSRMIRRKAA